MAKASRNTSLARLKKRLAKVPLDVRADAATEALLQARALGQAMQAAAPVEEGDLRASVRVEGGRRGDRWFVKAGGAKTTKPVRKSAKGAPRYDYALAVELGTAKMKARPFFYPTYRARRSAIRRAIIGAAGRAAQRFNGQS